MLIGVCGNGVGKVFYEVVESCFFVVGVIVRECEVYVWCLLGWVG